MINWTVTLTFEGRSAARELDDFEDALETFDAFVSSAPGLGFQAVMHVDSGDMFEATSVVRDHAERFAPGKVIELRAMSTDRLKHRPMTRTCPNLFPWPRLPACSAA